MSRISPNFPFPHLLFVSFFWNHHKLHVNSVQTAQREWQKDREPKLRQALKTAVERAIVEHPENEDLKYILKSTAERQLEHGLSK